MTDLARVFSPSLRLTVAALVVTVAVFPLLIVVGWLGVEGYAESAMRKNAKIGLLRSIYVLSSPPPASTAPSPLNDSGTWSVIEPVAAEHRVRICVFDDSGGVLADYDFDRRVDLSERAGAMVLGHRGSFPRTPAASSVRRDGVSEAISDGRSEGCRDESDSDMVVCYAAERLASRFGQIVVYAEDRSPRLLSALYDLRHRLWRITLVMLPFALALAWWVGRRVVRPVETLRGQVLAKVIERRPRADLRAPASAELTDLASAFNTLLDRLDDRRQQNEAFIADLVHEFKNPVAAIQVSADSLASANLTPERIVRTARVLSESSSRLDGLVTQFLELARAEAGMTHETWDAVDSALLCRTVSERLRQEGRFGHAELAVDAAGSAVVWGVPERLASVVENLLDNALSFAGDGGTVRATVRAAEGRALFTVEDDGPGIAGADLPHVFDRFFTTRRHDRGTGLGLALVRAIVEGHGGSVRVESTPGSGATFTSSIPLMGDRDEAPTA